MTTAHEHAGAIGPLIALRDRLGVEVVFVDAGDDGDDERTVAAFDAAITAGYAARVDLARPVDDRRGPARRAGSPSSPTPVAPWCWSTAPRRPARSRSVSTTLGADLYALPAQKWLLGPEGMGALVVDPASVADGSPRRSAAGSASSGSTETATATWWPDARRFEASGYHRPSVVGMARSIGWLSMYVGLDFVHRRGTAMAAPRPPRWPRSPA